jgi:hypothetical protein
MSCQDLGLSLLLGKAGKEQSHLQPVILLALYYPSIQRCVRQREDQGRSIMIMLQNTT